MDFHYLDSLKQVQAVNQNLLFVIFLHYLSAGLIYFKTTTVHYMQNRHQILWKCFKKGLKFATISPQKDFTAETCCCYFLLAQHSEVPQNSTHLSIWNYFFSWKKTFQKSFHLRPEYILKCLKILHGHLEQRQWALWIAYSVEAQIHNPKSYLTLEQDENRPKLQLKCPLG